MTIAPASVEVFGVTLIGVNERTAVKLALTLGLIGIVWAARRLALVVVRRLPGRRDEARRFWSRQGVQIAAAIALALGAVSIWVTPEADLSIGAGLVGAGLALALSQVITAFAGYLVILRGDVYTVGDRITVGGVRGDVVRLGFLKTTVLEMGQPPAVRDADPAVWVHSRQPTGRLVTVSNGAIFAEPVYNYSRDFPYMWEEIAVPIANTGDREAAERILLAAAEAEAVRPADLSDGVVGRIRRRYAIAADDLAPAVYWRIADDRLEMSVRFLVPDRGVRAVKDRISRRLLADFEREGLALASPAYDIASVPPIEIVDRRDGAGRVRAGPRG